MVFELLSEQCPNCGADLEPGARVCPECGSDENTGWSEAAKSAELGLPDDSFNYDEYVQREFSETGPSRSRLHWVWWVVAVLALMAIVWMAFH